jgi:hypothetical protein
MRLDDHDVMRQPAASRRPQRYAERKGSEGHDREGLQHVHGREEGRMRSYEGQCSYVDN